MPLSPRIQRSHYMCHSFCWTQVLHNKPGSFDKCRVRPRLSQPTWAVSLPINGCYYPHPPSTFVITQPER